MTRFQGAGGEWIESHHSGQCKRHCPLGHLVFHIVEFQEINHLLKPPVLHEIHMHRMLVVCIVGLLGFKLHGKSEIKVVL